MTLQGLIFDCDGTLADTMPLHWKAWQAVLARHRLRLPEARFHSLGGVPSRDIVRMLAQEQGLDLDPLVVAKEKEDAYLPYVSQVKPIRLVVDVARENFGKLPLAVASGGSRAVIDQVLEHLGIRSLFQALVTNEDIVHQKPAPDIYLEAARRLGVPPESCRAYEDTDLGLQAIRAAGMQAVDVRRLLQNNCDTESGPGGGQGGRAGAPRLLSEAGKPDLEPGPAELESPAHRVQKEGSASALGGRRPSAGPV
jgi:beta-phosphoglucomutase-like phosphatase (HAD superfamily)